MKRIILSLLLSICISQLFAHTIVQDCNKNGRVKFTCSDFSDNGKQYVKIHLSTGHWGNATADTLFQIAPSFSFVVYVPQPNSQVTVTVTFTNTNQNGSANGEQHTVNTNNCLALPLKFGDFKVTPIDASHAKVDVTVYDVSQVSNINITVSTDGKTYHTVGVILPDNVQANKNYSVIVNLK